MKWALWVALVALGAVMAAEVNISALNVTVAHVESAVDLSLISGDPGNAGRVSYSGYVQVDPSLTKNQPVNYFFWFFEALSSSKRYVACSFEFQRPRSPSGTVEQTSPWSFGVSLPLAGPLDATGCLPIVSSTGRSGM